MALSKQAILKHAGVFKTREVHVPAWADDNGDDVVLVRGMTLREFEINQSRSEEGKASASVIVRCVLAADGTRLFDDSDVNAIAELPMADAAKLTEAIVDESGLGGGKSESDAIDDAGKASEPTSDGSSNSD